MSVRTSHVTFLLKIFVCLRNSKHPLGLIVRNAFCNMIFAIYSRNSRWRQFHELPSLEFNHSNAGSCVTGERAEWCNEHYPGRAAR